MNLVFQYTVIRLRFFVEFPINIPNKAHRLRLLQNNHEALQIEFVSLPVA